MKTTKRAFIIIDILAIIWGVISLFIGNWFGVMVGIFAACLGIKETKDEKD
jgi:hypothetical protein